MLYGSVIMADNGKSLMCWATLEFNMCILTRVLLSMCRVIRFNSRPIFYRWFCRLSVAVEVIRGIQVLSSKDAIDESTFIQVR